LTKQFLVDTVQKKCFAKVLKNLIGYRSENNFVGSE